MKTYGVLSQGIQQVLLSGNVVGVIDGHALLFEASPDLLKLFTEADWRQRRVEDVALRCLEHQRGGKQESQVYRSLVDLFVLDALSCAHWWLLVVITQTVNWVFNRVDAHVVIGVVERHVPL